jgi:hypothetical protein
VMAGGAQRMLVTLQRTHCVVALVCFCWSLVSLEAVVFAVKHE